MRETDTPFEQLAAELNIPLTVDDCGFYTGYAKALALIVTDIIMGDQLSDARAWEEELRKIAKARFLSKFPYMRK